MILRQKKVFGWRQKSRFLDFYRCISISISTKLYRRTRESTFSLFVSLTSSCCIFGSPRSFAAESLVWYYRCSIFRNLSSKWAMLSPESHGPSGSHHPCLHGRATSSSAAANTTASRCDRHRPLQFWSASAKVIWGFQHFRGGEMCDKNKRKTCHCKPIQKSVHDQTHPRSSWCVIRIKSCDVVASYTLNNDEM